MVSDALQETRKRKFFAINASMILFPGLIGGFLAIASSLDKVKNTSGYAPEIDYYWIALVAISMFIGMANMISIKYIAAYKAQANLFLRQLNCLRQARDSLTYFKFEGKYPIHLMELMEGSVYYRVFGKHRKLYIGNEELRHRLEGSFSDSADKSLIGFLFITSLTLISAPFICLASVSIEKWNESTNFLIPFLGNPTYLVFLNMLLIVLSIIIFVSAHWENFKKLRTGKLYPDKSTEEELSKSISTDIELFKLKLPDFVSMILITIIALYWIYLGFIFEEELTIFTVIMVTLSLTSLFLIIICVKKVFFDSLNRIHKSIVHKLNSGVAVTRQESPA